MHRLLGRLCCCPSSLGAACCLSRWPPWIRLLLRLLLLLCIMLLRLLCLLVVQQVRVRLPQRRRHSGRQGVAGQRREHGQVQLQAAQPQHMQFGAAAPIKGRPVLLHLSKHLQAGMAREEQARLEGGCSWAQLACMQPSATPLVHHALAVAAR